jgi:hypothetical protein
VKPNGQSQWLASVEPEPADAPAAPPDEAPPMLASTMLLRPPEAAPPLARPPNRELLPPPPAAAPPLPDPAPAPASSRGSCPRVTTVPPQSTSVAAPTNATNPTQRNPMAGAR